MYSTMDRVYTLLLQQKIDHTTCIVSYRIVSWLLILLQCNGDREEGWRRPRYLYRIVSWLLILLQRNGDGEEGWRRPHKQ